MCLPAEVALEILDSLQPNTTWLRPTRSRTIMYRRTLHSLALVSRAWNILTLPYLWREVRIDSRRVALLISQGCSLVKYAKHVQRLLVVLGREQDPELQVLGQADIPLLLSILSKTPNLNYLALEYGTHEIVHQILSCPTLSSLTSLDVSCASETFEFPGERVSTLFELERLRISGGFQLESTPSQPLLRRLQRLHSLDIILSDDYPSLVSLDQLLGASPNLGHLTVHFTNSEASATSFPHILARHPELRITHLSLLELPPTLLYTYLECRFPTLASLEIIMSKKWNHHQLDDFADQFTSATNGESFPALKSFNLSVQGLYSTKHRFDQLERMESVFHTSCASKNIDFELHKICSILHMFVWS